MPIPGMVTGRDVFCSASPCLYLTLLLHIVLGSYVRGVMLNNLSILAISLLVILFFIGLARCIWPNINLHSRGHLLTELCVIISIIACVTLQQSVPVLPLPWLLGVAGIFPLVFDVTLALITIIAITAIGVSLDITLGIALIDWLPHLFAILFVGSAAMFLSNALHSNLTALQQSDLNERRFDAIARATRSVFLITDAKYRIKFANPALFDIIGYTPEEFSERNIQPIVHPDDLEEHKKKLRYLRDTPQSTIFSRHRAQHKNGRWIWLDTRAYNMLHDKAIAGLIFNIEDISAHKDAELKLDDEHALLRAVLDLNPSIIYAKDMDGRLTISNLSFQRHFGYSSEEELRGKTIHDIFKEQIAKEKESPPYDMTEDMTEQLHQEDLQIILNNTPLEDAEVQGFWESDSRNWYRVNKYPLSNAKGEIIGMLGIARDITDRKEYKMRLEYQALHDPLTNLPNRRFLLQTITAAITHCSPASPSLTILFCDLDFFKSVNDTHGHDFGDKCLVKITHRIRAQLLPQDFIARFGGNEFVILSHASLEEAKTKAETLLQAVSKPLVIGETVVKIHTSIGIALLHSGHKSPSELIRDADAAMYQAKERGRNRAEIFNASLQNTTTKRAQMDVALRFALERHELAIVYQPKISILDGSIKGFELLLRWNSPLYGHISPAEFIPVAESSGLVIPIGLWVLEEACKQFALWRARYPDSLHFTIAVNVSMKQLLQSTFLEDVMSILTRTGIAPSSIELELTETSAMANPIQTIENLSALKRLGLRLALDDFGTGYSSLAYLQKLPVDVLKIDKAFVKGLGKNPSDLEIVRLILALAQTLNIETVAEGVETTEDLLELKKMGCHLAQGFLFSEAVTAEAAEYMLHSQRRFFVA